MAPPLFHPFLRYMESTRHLVLYRLNSSYPIPPLLHLPHVETLCVLDCAPQTISSLLYRPFFPGLRRIHYLSAAPTNPLLYRRFPSVDWVFPWRERPYPFYDTMVEAGRGRMEQGLLHQYITRWEIQGKGGQLWFDLYLPGRGFVAGKEYVEQQRAYLHKKHCDGFSVPYPIVSDEAFFLPPSMNRTYSHAIADRRWISGEAQEAIDSVFDQRVLNLPDATPFHSSGR